MTLVDPSAVPPMIAANYQTADLVAALSWASSAVESYCDRHFAQVLGDVVRINPYTDGTALLPDPPVTAVSLVEGWLPSNGSMAWTTLTNYDWTPDGEIWDTTGQLGVGYMMPSWPVLPKSLRVTYDHGYVVDDNDANLPQVITDAVIKAAAIYLANPTNLAEYKVDDVTSRWSESNKTPILDDALLGAFRQVTV